MVATIRESLVHGADVGIKLEAGQALVVDREHDLAWPSWHEPCTAFCTNASQVIIDAVLRGRRITILGTPFAAAGRDICTRNKEEKEVPTQKEHAEVSQIKQYDDKAAE